MRRTYKYNGITLGVFIGIALGFVAYASSQSESLGIVVGVIATIGLSILFVFLIDKFERSLHKGAEMVGSAITGKRYIQSGTTEYVKRVPIDFKYEEHKVGYLRIPLDSKLPIISAVVYSVLMLLFLIIRWKVFFGYSGRIMYSLLVLISFSAPFILAAFFAKKQEKTLIIPAIICNPFIIDSILSAMFYWGYRGDTGLYMVLSAILGMGTIIILILTVCNILKDKKYLLGITIVSVIILPIMASFSQGYFAIDKIAYYFTMFLLTIALSNDSKKKYSKKKIPIYSEEKVSNEATPTELIKELNELRKSGAISEKEFNEKKKKLLERI